LSFALNRQKLRQARRREGRYLLRTNLCGREPAQLWQFYILLVEVEAAFKNLKERLPGSQTPRVEKDGLSKQFSFVSTRNNRPEKKLADCGRVAGSACLLDTIAYS
jgi:hypothetical protein